MNNSEINTKIDKMLSIINEIKAEINGTSSQNMPLEIINNKLPVGVWNAEEKGLTKIKFVRLLVQDDNWVMGYNATLKVLNQYIIEGAISTHKIGNKILVYREDQENTVTEKW